MRGTPQHGGTASAEGPTECFILKDGFTDLMRVEGQTLNSTTRIQGRDRKEEPNRTGFVMYWQDYIFNYREKWGLGIEIRSCLEK